MSETETEDGVRIPDLPVLGAVSDASSFVAHKSGSGRFMAPDVQTYILSSVTGDIIALKSQVDKNTADISVHGSAILELEATDDATATALLQVNTRIDSVEGDVADIETSVSILLTSDAEQASLLISLEATVGDHTSSINTLSGVTADQATQLTVLETTVGDHSASITILQGTSADQAAQITTLEFTSGEHTSQIETLSVASLDQAGQISTLTATDGVHTSEIETLQIANATLGATYSLRTDVNGYVTGFAITNSGSPAGSNVTFNTDNFRIVPVGGGTPQAIFSTEGGVIRIPNAHIGTAAIDQFKLANGAVITAGMALNAATEQFNFYAGPLPQYPDTGYHLQAEGNIVVPAGAAGYLYWRAQASAPIAGLLWHYYLYINDTLAGILPDPFGGFVAGVNSLQAQGFPVIFGNGTYNLKLYFASDAVPPNPADTAHSTVGHMLGFIQKR